MVTPLRDIQREQEQRRDLPTTPASSQGLESIAQQRRVQASNASSVRLQTKAFDAALLMLINLVFIFIPP